MQETRTTSDQDHHETGLGLLELVRGAADLWLAQPPAEKRTLLKLLVSNFVIGAGEVKIELNQPFDLLLETVDRAGEQGEAKWADLRTVEKWLRE